ncbi:hypothetical protein DsansV1_C13g0122781 [Dioscorea sansibarensis]
MAPASCCSGRERELLEELASLSGTSIGRTSSRRVVKPPDDAVEKTENLEGMESKDSQQSTKQNDLVQKLKDFVGSVANGALNWLKNNL